METLLCILLYLAAIVSPGQYYDYEIDAYAAEHQTTINDIQSDQQLLDQIVATYGPAAELIIVIDQYGEL